MSSAPKFNAILAKVGFKLEKGKIIPLDQENIAQNGSSPSAPPTPRAKKVAPRKLKVKEGENEAGDEGDTTPAKVTPRKRRAKEEEDESEDGDGPTSAKATTTKAVPKKHKAEEEDSRDSDDEEGQEAIRAKAVRAKTALKRRKVNAEDVGSGTETAPSTLKTSHVEGQEEKSQDEEGELVVAEGGCFEDDAAETA